MEKVIFYIIFTISIALSRAKDEDLPLCPTNFQYFPQNLPMHCRMPSSADFPGYPRVPGFPTGPPPADDKQPMPMPVPIPGMAGPMPMPGAIPMPGPMMPLPGPMPMPGAPGQKLPVIVMPFYSPDTSFKKPDQPRRPGGPGWKKPKRPHESAESDDTDTSSDTSDTDTDSSSENGWWKGKKHGWRKNGRRTNKRRHSHNHRSKKRHSKKKKDLLTPVLQYVTNDGYVIYEKTISKGEAKDWLRVNKEEHRQEQNEGQNNEDLDASVRVEDNAEVVEIKRSKSKEDEEDKDEADEKEVTTPQTHDRRYHRKATAPAINKLLPKRAF